MSSNGATLAVPVGRPLEQLLGLCHDARLPVLLRGGTGVGKSQTLEKFARSRGLAFISRDLSLMEPPDLIGLPRPDGAVTRYLPPAFLPSGGRGVLALEEINRAPSYMRAPCLQLLTARTLNDYALPDGWWVAAAINPAGGGYEADELDPALAARFVQIDVVADPAEWAPWARASGIHPCVIDYVEADPTAFDSPASNPRSWAHVSELLRADERAGVPPMLLQAAVAGCVGPERGAAFCAFLVEGEKPLAAEDVFARYGANRAALADWVEAGRLDLLRATLLNVEKIQSHGGFSAVQGDRQAWANLGRFLSDLPGDLGEEAERFFAEREYPLPGRKGVRK